MQAYIIRQSKHRQGRTNDKQVYIWGKTDEYSSKQAWSSIDEQYPEDLTRGVTMIIQARYKRSPNDKTREAINFRAGGDNTETRYAG